MDQRVGNPLTMRTYYHDSYSRSRSYLPNLAQTDDTWSIRPLTKGWPRPFYPTNAFESLAFWTMPITAGVVANLQFATIIASLYMSTECCGTAILNGVENAVNVNW